VPVEINPVRRREIAENDFNEWFETARSNFKGFKLRFANASCPKDFMLCAFDLQQAVEICYKTVEVVFSHYIPYEHRLIILLGRALKFDRRIKQAFPRETEEERNLFDQLDLAYIGARYHSFEEFPVYKEQLIYWCDKAEKVLALTREICREKIDLLKNIEKDFNG
jgi:HEPN domain-containing protein